MVMNNLKIYKIEIDLLSYLYNEIGCEKFTTYLTLVKNIEREFTGIGAYISFEFHKKERLSIESLRSVRLTGPMIHSDEFEHNVLVSYVFDEIGVLDYIEFEFGMKERKYPSKYSFAEPNINIIP